MSENGNTEIPTRHTEANSPPYVAEILARNDSLFSHPLDSTEFRDTLNSWTSSINSRLTLLRGNVDVPPSVSVVIPAKDETHNILPLLESLANQDSTESMEVVVAANNCSEGDMTAEIARASGAKVFEYSNLDRAKHSPITLARQNGLEDIEGEIIVSTDADVIAPPSWVRVVTKPLDDPAKSVVAGGIKHYRANRTIRMHDLGTRLARRASLAAGMLGRFGIEPKRANQMAGGANMAFRKKDAIEIGGYDFSIPVGEDSKMGNTLAKIGDVKLIQDDSATVYVSPRRIEHASKRDLAKGRIWGFRKLYLDENDQLIDYRDEVK